MAGDGRPTDLTPTFPLSARGGGGEVNPCPFFARRQGEKGNKVRRRSSPGVGVALSRGAHADSRY